MDFFGTSRGEVEIFMESKSGKKRMLILSSRWIYPLDAGYKMRIHYMAKVLSKLYTIDLLCLEPTGILPEDHPFEHILSFPLSRVKIVLNILKYFLKGWPLQVGGYYDQQVKNFLEKNLKKYDAIYINHVRLAPYAFDLKNFRVLDYHDAISMNYNEALNYARGLWKIFYKFESNKLLDFEKKALTNFDLSLITSEKDREYLLESIENRGKFNLEIIPMGIRKEVLDYPEVDEEKPWIVMLGKMSYYPNYEGAMFFIRRIFPILRERYDWLELYIVGSDPPLSLKKFNSRNGVHITGFVEDPWYYVSRSLLTIAPIRIGAGIQNKVLEAMALGKSVVATSRALQGLNVGVEGKHYLKANSEDEFINKISYLVDNDNIRKEIGLNAELLVKDYFTWDVIGKKIYNIFKLMEDKKTQSKN